MVFGENTGATTWFLSYQTCTLLTSRHPPCCRCIARKNDVGMLTAGLRHSPGGANANRRKAIEVFVVLRELSTVGGFLRQQFLELSGRRTENIPTIIRMLMQEMKGNSY